MNNDYRVESYSVHKDPETIYDLASEELRYRVVDAITGKVLDDAQGYGYKSAQKAHAAWNFKRNGGYSQSVITAGKWLENHPAIIKEFEMICEINLKEPDFKGITIDSFRKVLENESISFTAADLKKAWEKGLDVESKRKKLRGKDW